MSDCLFCSIIDGEIDAEVVYGDEEVVAFKDVNPQAPVHILIVPRRHIETIDDITAGDETLMGRLVDAARRIAEEKNITDGYRLVFNCGENAGQEVMHIHLHLLAGREMNWPPG